MGFFYHRGEEATSVAVWRLIARLFLSIIFVCLSIEFNWNYGTVCHRL